MTPAHEIVYYQNRQMFDQTTKRLVSSDDLLRLVDRGVGFCVRHYNTRRDMTPQILLRLLVVRETEQCGATVALTAGFLRQLIRTRAGVESLKLRAFLDHAMQTWQLAPTELEQPAAADAALSVLSDRESGSREMPDPPELQNNPAVASGESS